MRALFTEKNIVVILFIMVLVTFSLAQKETKRMEQLYNGGQTSIKNFAPIKPVAKAHDSFILSSPVN
jgi:hypothetical protein